MNIYRSLQVKTLAFVMEILQYLHNGKTMLFFFIFFGVIQQCAVAADARFRASSSCNIDLISTNNGNFRIVKNCLFNKPACQIWHEPPSCNFYRIEMVDGIRGWCMNTLLNARTHARVSSSGNRTVLGIYEKCLTRRSMMTSIADASEKFTFVHLKVLMGRNKGINF